MGPGAPKTDIDNYFDQTKSHIKTLVEDQLKEMWSAKIIMILWVRWKNPVKLAITLDLEDVEGVHIKTQVENPRMPESGFTLDQIMHLHINFDRLTLTRGSSYMKLPEWIARKKAVINPKNEDEQCFKWAVIAALHHEEIKKDHQRISRVQHYEDQYNWNGVEFPLAIQKIGKFGKNNPGIVVNVLFNKKKSIYTARKSELNRKCSK